MSRAPTPVKSDKGSKTGRPIMALLDLLGRRMALRMLWELSRSRTPLTFRALQAAADTNPSLLNTRLKELRAADIIELTDTGYTLTTSGASLLKVLLPLHAWSEAWAKSQMKAAKVPAKRAVKRRR